MSPMPKTHPHAEATYRVIPLEDGSFGVEVSIPETFPTTVSKFDTEADAETWIEQHKSRVQAPATRESRFRRSPSERHGQ